MGVPISNVTRRVVYTASGTGPYSFTFEILANTDIAVYKDDTLLTLTTDYTVTINTNGTGSVTLTASPTGATQIAIVGNRTIQRSTDFVTGGDFFANTVNNELDQQTIFAQQNAEGLQRALQAPQTDPTSINMTLPGKAARAGKTLSFDSNGNPTPGVSASDVANAVTYATNAANSATAAASSASSASSSASTASTKASEASTSATNAASSASSASTSASNASSSASAASTSASNASTSATNAASSASRASTSASTATTQATNASNSASAASTSATNASNSASAASTSATNASNSATAAAASAAAAASSYDSFDDRYLGTKSSAPTLDNDGNALVTGALYYNTTTQVMNVYDGANWIAATAAGTAAMSRYRYVATAGQTTFSGADTNSLTLSYISGNIVVNRNGSTLDSSEYTASNGTSVVLTVAAAVGDIVDVIAFKSFTVADTYSKGEVDGFTVKTTGNQTVAGTKTFSSEVSVPNTFGFKNRIINGAMVIDQRNAGASLNPSNGQYSVDRWLCYLTQLSKFTVQQSSIAPAGFTNSLLVTSSSAYSVTSGDLFNIGQFIEGYNIADLAWGSANAQPVTLSFWVRSSLTGTFGGVVRNVGGGTRSYPFTYTISSANTWEQKTINIAGDTTGSWNTTNGQGIGVLFDLGVGSTYKGTAGAWANSNLYGATGATSVVGTSGATFYITGVQLEKGSTATSFDYRPYGTELQLCQRYYIKYANSGAGFMGITGQVSGSNSGQFMFPISMRSAPTPGYSNINVNDTSVNNAVSSIAVASNTTNCIIATLNCSSNTLTVGRAGLIYTASNGYIDLSAEL